MLTSSHRFTDYKCWSRQIACVGVCRNICLCIFIDCYIFQFAVTTGSVFKRRPGLWNANIHFIFQSSRNWPFFTSTWFDMDLGWISFRCIEHVIQFKTHKFQQSWRNSRMNSDSDVVANEFDWKGNSWINNTKNEINRSQLFQSFSGT